MSFEGSLVHKASSGIARSTQRNTVSETKAKQTNKIETKSKLLFELINYKIQM